MIQSESREAKQISFHLSFPLEGEGEITIPRWHFTGNETEAFAKADAWRREVKEQFNKLKCNKSLRLAGITPRVEKKWRWETAENVHFSMKAFVLQLQSSRAQPKQCLSIKKNAEEWERAGSSVLHSLAPKMRRGGEVTESKGWEKSIHSLF